MTCRKSKYYREYWTIVLKIWMQLIWQLLTEKEDGLFIRLYSHMNAFIRIKLAVCEDNPTVKPYNQDDWVLTNDVMNVPVNYSITLIHALHHRLYTLLDSLTGEQLMRTYYHPEYDKTTTIWQLAHNYAWHGKHHSEQIRQLRIRNGW